MRAEPALEPQAILAARADVDPAFLDSPQFVHERLSGRLGAPVVVKVESLNPIGSFKGRGTSLAVRRLVEAGRVGEERAVVAASTGNFGQGVAYAGRRYGVPVTVFAHERANPAKLERIRRLGAEVRVAGADFDAAREAAAELAAATGGVLLTDGEDPNIAAGAASLAIELTDAIEAGRLPALAVAAVPVGNGSLILGVGAWLKAGLPGCRVVGVAAAAAPSMALSFEAGQVIETASAATYAEGIACRVPVPIAVELMAGRVDEMRLVEEDEIRAAQAELTDELGLTVEGAAAAAWAGLLQAPPPGPALLIVSGTNRER